MSFETKIKEAINEVDSLQIIPGRTDSAEFKTWYRKTNKLLTTLFGENSNELSEFASYSYLPIGYISGDVDSQINNAYTTGLKRVQTTLISYMEDAIEKDSSDNNEEVVNMIKLPETKIEKQVFISHSSEDVEYVKMIVDLLVFIGLDQDTLFCSSVPGYDIPCGANIYDYLKDKFELLDLHVIFIHSDNFYSSAVSLNEMGAAWLTKSKHTSFLLPNFDFNSMSGVIDSKEIAIKLDTPNASTTNEHLRQLKETLEADFGLKPKSATPWEGKRDKFLSEIRALGTKDNESKKKDDDILYLLKMAHESKERQDFIYKRKELRSGTIIELGDRKVTIDGDNKSAARWESILECAISKKLLSQSDSKGEVFKITHQGFQLLENS